MRPRAHQLATELRSRVAGVLRGCTAGTVASEQLAGAGFGRLLDEFAAENVGILHNGLAAGTFRAAVVNDPDFLHFAALVPVSTETRDALALAVSNVVARRHFPLTKLWAAYADALLAFPEPPPSASQLPRQLRGYETHFAEYVAYMYAGTPVERERCRAAIAESFVQRNCDKRLRDWTRLNGDGHDPVKWDFRIYALDRAG